MATGFSNKLVGQIGEFLVCAELGRRGLVATPFAGNVPGYDVIATNEVFRSVPIQVKTSNGSSWQFSGKRLLRIDFDPNTGHQRVLGRQETDNLDLIHVFVWLGHSHGQKDRFFILTKHDFLSVVEKHYASYLAKHGGRRPRKPESMHTAVRVPDLESFEDNWELIASRLLS